MASTVLFRRPARRRPPGLPRGEVIFESPPDIPEVQAQGAMRFLMMLPMVAGAGAMALMFSAGGRGGIMLVASGLYGVAMLGMFASQMGRGANEKAQELDGNRRDYLRYLTQVRRRVRRAAEQQRAAVRWRYPDPSDLWSVAMSRRLWERRPSDDDFASVRIALGTQQTLIKLIPPESKPVEDLDPLAAASLRRFVLAHRTVPSVPIALSLRTFRTVRLAGNEDSARSLSRAMVAHLATFHTPDEMTVAVAAAPERRAAWEWAKWLPHALHPSQHDGTGQIRLVASTGAELESLLGEEVDQVLPQGVDPAALPRHVVVVLDGVDLPAGSPFAPGTPGVTTLRVMGPDGLRRAPDDQTAVLDIAPDRVELVQRGPDGPQRQLLGAPDGLGAAEAEALARLLAPYRSSAPRLADGSAADDETETVRAPEDLPTLLGAGDPYALDPATAWRPRPHRNRLRVPFGVDEDGRPVELDIKESAQGGMGPHGLVIGATGSGKSEFLRTLVLGMAMTHSSDELNLVLVDFKGGATFLGLDELPHVSAVITNLEDELPLVDRMQDALHGEMVRRQELLRSAGNFASRRDYEHAREQGAALAPLPSLFVVVDEFSELLAARPQFIELFVMIGRLGRSLGVHLMLASQRLEEGKLRGLDTHLSYRIALRTFSAGESRAVLGVPDAYELPPKPGNGYLKFDTTNLVRFKAAYVSGPWRPDTGPVAASGPAETRAVYHVTPYTSAFIQPELVEVTGEPVTDGAMPLEPGRAHAQAPMLADESLLDVVVGRLRDQGRPAHRVWLPPLDDPATLDQLLPTLERSTERGLTVAAPGLVGTLRTPVGLIDKPYDQRRDPLWVDISGAGGNVAVVGGPQSGKSTLVRALMGSFALTHTPAEVQFYCLDFGGGTLSALSGLPHVGGVTSRLDQDRVRRTVAELSSLLQSREVLFTGRGIDSISAYRRMRRDGSIEPDRFASDVVLVVDGWLTLRQDFEALEQTITTLAARGLGFGIHVVTTANKWSDLRMGVRDLFQSQLELRLGEAFESAIDRKAAVNVPKDRPGRGIAAGGLHTLGALPRIDGKQTAEDLADGQRAFVSAVADAWSGNPAPPVRLLPLDLPYDAIPVVGADARPGVPFGIDEEDLAPVYLDFDTEPHFAVVGDPECGKSTLLRVIAKGLVDRLDPGKAKIMVIDYRRSLLGAITTEHLIGYAASSESAATLLQGVAGAVKKRLPGPDVSQEDLRNRSWWSGAEIFVIVDDYELVATQSGNPLSVLQPLVGQAQDIGLHLIIARGMGGAGRGMYEPVLQRLKEGGSPGLVMSGPRDEGAIFGTVRPSKLPVGRGTLVSRRMGDRLVQVAHLPADSDLTS